MKKSPILLLVAISWVCFLVEVSQGQIFRGRPRTEYFRSKVQIAGSRLAVQDLDKAKKDIANKEYATAVRLIQKTIDKFGDRAIKIEEGRYVGIHDFCNRLLESLPPEGKRTYLQIYDSYAKILYHHGIKEQDTEKLRETYFRYRNTSYGKPALAAAISIEFENGNLETTRELALLFRSLYGDAPSNLGPISALVMATAFLNQRENLSSLKKELSPALLKKGLIFGAKSVTLATLIEEELRRINRISAVNRLKAPRAQFFKTEQWLHELPMLPRSRSTPARCDDFGEFPSPSQFPWNPVNPIVDESSVYLSNGIFVQALELFSNAEKWRFRGWAQSSQARQNRGLVIPLTLSNNTIYASLETPLRPERRIWTFVPQQQISHRQLVALDASTGKVLWQHYRWRGKTRAETEFIAKLNINSDPLIIGDRLFVSASKFHTSYHQYLCCFDRNTGELRWSTFISTGQMEQNMFGNRVREAVCGQLAEKDGQIYLATNIGVVAVIDARLGTLKHTATYEQIRIPRQTRFDPSIQERAPAWVNSHPIIVGDQVFFAPMDSHEVLVMNRHSGVLRKTGIKRTRFNRYRYLIGPSGPWIIAAGTRLCFYNTETNAKFEPTYVFSSARRGQSTRSAGIIAKPIILDGKLIAPVNYRGTEKILIWSIADQRVIDEVTFNQSRKGYYLGNLAQKDGVFVTAATTTNDRTTKVRCYFSRPKVRAMLMGAIAANPQDIKAHFRLGEFALQGREKDYSAAIASFELALKLAENSVAADRQWAAKTKGALSRLYLELASESRLVRAKTGLDDLTCYLKASEIATSALQKVEILFLLLRRSFDRQDRKTFEDTYAQLTGDFESTPYDYEFLFRGEVPEAKRRRYPNAGFLATAVAAAFEEQMGKPQVAIRLLQDLLSRWPEDAIGSSTAWEYGYGQIERLITKHGRSVYAIYDREAKRLLEMSRSKGDIRPLRKLVERYPNAETISQAYSEISKHQFANREYGAAAKGIQEFFAKFGKVTGSPLALLAQSFEALGRPQSAMDAWGRLAKLGPHEVDDPSLIAHAQEKLDGLGLRNRIRPLPLQSFGLNANLVWQEGLANGTDSWKLVKGRGRRTGDEENIVLAQMNRKLLAFDLQDGKKIWSIDAHARISEGDVFWYDGLLIINVDDGIIGLDPHTGDELWRHPAEELEITGLAAGQGKVYVTFEISGFAVNFRLRALSIEDGSVIAQRIMDGVTRSEGIQCGQRWIMIPLESRLTCMVLDGFTLENSPAWPEGADYDDGCTPILAADDCLISIPNAQRSSSRELTSRDPATGRTKWRRKIGASRVRFYQGTPWHTIYKLDGQGRKAPKILLVIDNLSGTALTKQKLGRFTSIFGSPQVAGTSLFTIKLQLSGRRSAYNLEESAMKTNSIRWRSTNFTGNRLLASFPFQQGVVLRVVEHRRGTRATRKATTLYLVDRESGKIESEIRLSSRRSNHVPEVQLLNGHLVVSDGPVLKVFKP